MRLRPFSFRLFAWIPQILSIILFAMIAQDLLCRSFALAQVPAPQPLRPEQGDRVITPRFSWMASTGAAKYQVRVGPQSDPNLVYWEGVTYQLGLTPNDSDPFPNEPLYWQVCAYELASATGDCPGPWSSKVGFTKFIPAPPLRSPAGYVAIPEPEFGWEPVAGAAYYKVELSRSPSFAPVDYTYTSYNTSLTPNTTVVNSGYYWRVRGVDVEGHEGDNSAVRYFVKHIPAPELLYPLDGVQVIVPTFEWLPVSGAAQYIVEVSRVDTFNLIEASYDTSLPRLTPNNSLDNGLYYWRVRGVDEHGNQGSNSNVQQFTKIIPMPQAVLPAEGATVSLPYLEWTPVAGAVKYRVEVASNPDFSTLAADITTYNTQLIPRSALALGTYFWRVTGLDEDGHASPTSAARSFNLAAAPAPSGAAPALQSPALGEVVPGDPTFRWSLSQGASTYRLVVSRYSDFHVQYDAVISAYPAYSPYIPGGLKRQYVNDLYYWKVEARNSSGSVIATSPVNTFTKGTSVPLLAPEDGAVLASDPGFEWAPVSGAARYYLTVSRQPDFDIDYDFISTEYPTYDPYTPGLKDSYANDVYYWQVEARSPNDVTIATSEARSFTRQSPMAGIAPPEGSYLMLDPTFRWTQVTGAHTYRLVVSRQPDFSTQYDTVITPHTSFTPYGPSLKDTYANGVYYWRVDARSSSDVIMTTSPAQSITKSASLRLLEPAEGAILGGTPSFAWDQVTGAATYRLVVSRNPLFSTTYDAIITDYTSYTPFTPGLKDNYDEGAYYWKVEARSHTGSVLFSSLTGTFTLSSTQPTSTPVGAPTSTPTRTPTITLTPTLAPGDQPQPTPAGPLPTARPLPGNSRTLGAVTVYADSFEDLGQEMWKASGNIRLGGSQHAYVELSQGEVTLDYSAQSIRGDSGSHVGLLMDNGVVTPIFAGPFSVDPSNGEIAILAGAISQLYRLGDFGVDLTRPILDLSLNALSGSAGGTVRLTVYPLEGFYPTAQVAFTLGHDGRLSGQVEDMDFEVAGVTFSVTSAEVIYSPAGGGKVVIHQASISLPEEFDLGGEGSIEELVITANGLEKVGGGSITLELPEMSVPGTGGRFELAGASVTLSLAQGGKYMIHGRADFSLPNIASTGEPNQYYSGELYAEFELDQDGLRYVLMGGEVEPGIPIGQSGFALTGLEGRVTLSPEVRVQITGTLESQIEVPPLGPLVSGTPSVWVQLSEPYEVGISGSVQVLIFDAAEASLVLSQASGLTGSVHVNYIPYALSGDASLHVWRSGGEFHFTGSASVELGFGKGELYESCWEVCLPVLGCESVCLSVPPFDMTLAGVQCDFGEFCANESCDQRTYGLKGTASVLDGAWEGSFFIDLDGNLVAGDDADEYALYTQSNGLAGSLPLETLQAGYTDTYTITVGATDQALFMLGWKGGAPTLQLEDPGGHVIDPAVDPGVHVTQVGTSLYMIVDNPQSGAWNARVGELQGDEFYLLNVLGSNVPPQVSIDQVEALSESQIEIGWSVVDPDDQPVVALYYDTDGEGTDGALIAQGLDQPSGVTLWDASEVQSGQYSIYALADDLKNDPAHSYYSETITIVNSQPPQAPTGLSAQLDRTMQHARVCWQRNPESDVTGYRVLAGSQSGVYDLGTFQATNLTCYTLPISDWLDTIYVGVLAYDNSGNESLLSNELVIPIDRRHYLYMPYTRR